MNNQNKKILLIIPCFNEEARLKLDLFAQFQGAHYLFVDDYSTDDTAKILKNFVNIHPQHRLIQTSKNLGKGESIRYAVNSLPREELEFYDWIGFWDADLSTPFFELDKMIFYSKIYTQSAMAIFCSRVVRLGSNIQRSFHRKILGYIFKQIIEILFQIKSYDTQCGAKIFHSKVVAEIFQEPFISRWVFDIELILRLKDKFMIEYPLQEWTDVPGSKLKFFREVLRISWDIVKIKIRYS